MSSKDIRSFVTSYHASDAERMVRRAREGIACTSFKPVDYDRLRNVIAEKKFSGQESLVKLKKIETAARQRKDENALKQHLNVWNHELVRLGALRRQIEADIQSLVRDAAFDHADGALQRMYEDIDQYRESLNEDFDEFKRNTTDPVWQLRNDLHVWVKAHKRGKADKSIEMDEPEDVLATITSVRQQQDRIRGMLAAEQDCLESELHIEGLLDTVVHSETKHVETGIPEEAFDLPCPDRQLKVDVLQQFIFLDGKYVEKLNELDRENADVLGEYNEIWRDLMSELQRRSQTKTRRLCDATGGWSRRDHELFVYIFDAYVREVTSGRRLLFIDCLQRCLSHRTRADIIEHEDWWTRTKFFHQRRRDLLIGWIRDRAELLDRVKNVFNEACLAKQLEDVKQENRQKQQEFCDYLYAKVSEWRQRKMEAFRLEQELAEAARARAEMVRNAEEEKERVKRQQQREKIQMFHDDLEVKRKQKEEADKQRLSELQNYLAEQAAYDRERVKFREEELLKKQEEKQKKMEEQAAMAEEKERILEAIRAKVRPDVECDLLRLWSDTEAWQARQKPEEYSYIQKPLFDITTFTSERVMADPRVRVEQRIREAGLQNNEYARRVMQQMQPPRPARRDMESTVFR